MTANELVTLIGGIVTAINALFLVYFASKRNKPEVKKLEGEAESELQEAANLNLEGAKISAQMLLDRINELKGELDTEKKLRKEGMALAERTHKDSMEALEKAHNDAISAMDKKHRDSIAALEKARKEDADYFRRRIKELDKELRAYRSYAAKLSKQVIEAGRIPVALVFDYTDSDPNMLAIRPDLEDGSEDTKEDAK